MAVLRASETRKMQKKDTDKKLAELRLELAKIKGNISMGASAQSPGRIKEIRRAIARIKTIESEIKGKSTALTNINKRLVEKSTALTNINKRLVVKEIGKKQ